MIEIKIGMWSGVYEAYKTSAPVEYDGFGTITLYSKQREGKPLERLVLIPIWQVGRYRSGLHAAEPFPAAGDNYAQDKLVKRLLQTEDK